MNIMEAVDCKSDYIGKKALLRVSVNYVDMANVPDHHIEHVQKIPTGYRARGFAIVTILEVPDDATYVVRVGREEVTCGVNHLYRILLDDEPEPDVWQGQPRLA